MTKAGKTGKARAAKSKAPKPLKMTKFEIKDEGMPFITVIAETFDGDPDSKQRVAVGSPDLRGLGVGIEALRKASVEAGGSADFEIEYIDEKFMMPGNLYVAVMQAVPVHVQSAIGKVWLDDGPEDDGRTRRSHFLAEPHFTEWRSHVLEERAKWDQIDKRNREREAAEAA